mmetsp:Transcript_1569/g.2511  ORF Transcript_1569/g.2511 Transcript_1569/m.2511 type:complete len:326 (+) Transcript_1569:91-1068(+)
MDVGESVLRAPPGDGISCLSFSPYSKLLLLSSWDSTARLYDVSNNSPKATFNFRAGTLACCFQNDEVGFACGLDNQIHSLNLDRGSTKLLGQHRCPVSCMQYDPHHNFLVTGSWDSTATVWDPRQTDSAHCTAVLNLPGKAYSLSLTSTRIVVATSERHIVVYDSRNLSAPEQVRESPLRYQTRKVSCFPNGEGFALGSIEGRVAVEYFEQQPDGKRYYAFKCHRRGDVAYPVNAIAFHPVYGTLATGGCDGIVNVWDCANKKRLSQFHQYPTSIASLAFSNDGSMLAIASSYTFEEGEKEAISDDNVFLRCIQDVDVRPRPSVE